MSCCTHAPMMRLKAESDLARVFLGAAVGTVGALLAYRFMGQPTSGIDDADITMAYARNIARGFGYVYQQGGERVEGSTSALWTLLCAVWFSFNAKSFASLFVVSGALTVVTTTAVIFLARLCSRSEFATPTAALLTGAAATFYGWSSGTLMDSALWSAVCSASALALIVPPTRASLFAGCVAMVGLVLTRPEGMLLAPVWAIFHGIGLYLRGVHQDQLLRRLAWLLGTATVVLVVSTGIRYSYFGYPFPNTYYAKLGGDRIYTAIAGIKYISRFARSGPLPLVILALLGVATYVDGRAVIKRLRHGTILDAATAARAVLALMFAAGLGLRILEGGDHFEGYRVLQPFVPLGCALSGATLATLFAERARRSFLLPLSFGLLLMLLIEWRTFAQHRGPTIAGEHELALDHRAIGKRLHAAFASERTLPSIGVVVAGGIALEYPGRIYDLMGLNWVEMAHASDKRRGLPGHSSFNQDVFWKSPITLVIPGIVDSPKTNACDVYDHWYDEVLSGLLSSTRFRHEYRAATLAAGDRRIHFFVRADYEPLARIPGARLLDWPAGTLNGQSCDAYKTTQPN